MVADGGAPQASFDALPIGMIIVHGNCLAAYPVKAGQQCLLYGGVFIPDAPAGVPGADINSALNFGTSGSRRKRKLTGLALPATAIGVFSSID